MPSADYKVEIVTDSGEADMSVSIVGDQVVDLTGATPGEVLTIQGDGTVAPSPAGTPGAHATTHEVGGTDVIDGVLGLAGLTVSGGGFRADSAGRLGVGGSAVAATTIINHDTAHPGTATVLIGTTIAPILPATTTAGYVGHYAKTVTAAAAFTLPFAWVFNATSPTVGAGSAITLNEGFVAGNQGAAGVVDANGLRVSPQSGASGLNVAANLGGGTTANLWLNSNTATAAGGIALGLTRDVAIFRAGAVALGITGSLAVSGNFAANGVTPAARSTFTQTYATASLTVANMTAAAVATTAAQLAGYGYTQAQADAIVTALNALITDVTESKKNITSIVDALQAAGLAA